MDTVSATILSCNISTFILLFLGTDSYYCSYAGLWKNCGGSVDRYAGCCYDYSLYSYEHTLTCSSVYDCDGTFIDRDAESYSTMKQQTTRWPQPAKTASSTSWRRTTYPAPWRTTAKHTTISWIKPYSSLSTNYT